jgi:hypothetical protein
MYPACAEELYSDVVIIILCNSSFIPVLYGFVPLETGIARDSLFLGLSRMCRESGFRSRKFGSFQQQPFVGPEEDVIVASSDSEGVDVEPIQAI